MIIEEVAREVQAIRQAQEGVIEAQRRGFQIELERVREKLQQVESRSTTLESEIETLKTLNQTPDQRPTQDTSATRRTPTAPASTKPTEGKKMTDPNQRTYAQIAASNPANNAAEKLGQRLPVVAEDGKLLHQARQK